jgi:hypothetical protein
MFRNLKALGLVLVAVFAISAMSAAAAQAETADFWSEGTHIDGIADGTQTFVVGSFELTCTGVDGTAELKEQSAELTATNIEYTTCHTVKLGITFPVTVDMNGCDYLFTAGTYEPEATEKTGAAKGSVHIKCPKNVGGPTPEGQTHITITIFKAGGAHTTENLRCDIDVAEQTPTEGTIDYNNELTEGVHAVTVQATNIKVIATTTETSSLCPETKEDEAIYNGSFWAKGTNAAHTAYVNTTVTGTP